MLYKQALELLGVPDNDAKKLLKTYDNDLNKATNQEKRELVTTWFELKIKKMAENIYCKNLPDSCIGNKALQVMMAFNHKVPMSSFDMDGDTYHNNRTVKAGSTHPSNKHPCLGHGMYGKPTPSFAVSN